MNSSGFVDGPNLYAYGRSAPTIHVDLTGRNSIAVGVTIGIPWGPPGVVIGVVAGGLVLVGGIILADRFFNKPPKDAADPEGAKAPGRPGPAEGFCPPKEGQPEWGRGPNGEDRGWIDADGNVWVPTGPDLPGNAAHGGPHWDVQTKGGYYPVYPGGRRR
jgi:hypothetical protein